ncbi:hypothetical protein [Macrococcoides caseolyticum]|uniref:hypothetical protein n=1 Tax=Macrococcoides caseolyticum TaxID=69966 RepID=UPI001F3807CA|nr:hypothetical protein [Macrococcus caseolyticus]MCE4957270.1 hypothetical protein [Macrococcus caseolyticus]
MNENYIRIKNMVKAGRSILSHDWDTSEWIVQNMIVHEKKLMTEDEFKEVFQQVKNELIEEETL